MNATGQSVAGWQYGLISVFILFHIVTCLSYAINPAWVLKYNPISASYVHLFGLYQQWAMFEKAPTGKYYLVFFVTFKNGKKELIEFAHMNDLDRLKQLQMHRFRKFQQSSVFNPANSFLWKDLCLWVMNNYSQSQQKDIAKIELAQNYAPLRDEYSAASNGEETSRLVYTFYPADGSATP
ncbi:MAG: hypothetical protein K2X81_16515 [Candidatus Obscuribacterales bacterium]|nr:hypothetical protein [Candidatus Obscuribacterales bacterium]